SHRMTKRAFTLIEVLILLTVFAIIGVGVGVGLQSISQVPRANSRMLGVAAELNSEADYWKALAWGNAPWPASLPYNATDTVTIKIGGQNVTLNRTVSIQIWDPNNLATNSSPKTDFARVLITIDAQSIAFFTTKPL
ncbi:MAG: hypothetical protein WCI73_03550, partial [Phycisphaerae bacterium]